MLGKLVGIKYQRGTRKSDGQAYSVSVAMFNFDHDEKSLSEGSVGISVKALTIPDEFKDTLCEKNLNKNFEFSTYYNNGREYLRYAFLAK